MFFGTFIGSLADRLGRKRFCLLYVALYVGSCMTKHYRNFWILMLGRLLGGVATSLLFSVFDAWMVYEHNQRGFDPEWMSSTFSSAAFGNSLVAIGAGVVAQAAADSMPLIPAQPGGELMYGGFCAPFDLAIAVLLFGGGILYTTWGENFGNGHGDAAVAMEEGGKAAGGGSQSDITLEALMDVRGLKKGIEAMQRDPIIAIWFVRPADGAICLLLCEGGVVLPLWYNLDILEQHVCELTSRPSSPHLLVYFSSSSSLSLSLPPSLPLPVARFSRFSRAPCTSSSSCGPRL